MEGLHQRLGTHAGLLAAGLALGLLGGVVWGMTRPTYTVVMSDGAVVVDPAASATNVEIATIGWMTIISSVIGVALAIIALRQVRSGHSTGGIGAMLWLIVVAAASALTVTATGDMVAHLLHPVPETPDGPFELAPMVNPPTVLAVAPFFAAGVYWVSTVMGAASRPTATAPQIPLSPAY